MVDSLQHFQLSHFLMYFMYIMYCLHFYSRQKPTLKSQSVRIDDAEIERHKATQRQKAQTLAQKQQIRHNSLDQDRLRKNNDFLDRLEGKR